MFPVTIDEYPCLFDYVLTADGLIFFYDLRRKHLQGKPLSIDDYNKLRLLYIYYATANRNPKEVSHWQELCTSLDAQGIPEQNTLQSKEDLIKKLLITKNPNYQSGLYRKHIEYMKNNRQNFD